MRTAVTTREYGDVGRARAVVNRLTCIHKIYLNHSHNVPHEHVVPRPVLVVRETEPAYLRYCEWTPGHVVDAREPIVSDVGNNYDGVRSALDHVLHYMPHRDGGWETVAEGRCLPARCHGYVVTENVQPR